LIYPPFDSYANDVIAKEDIKAAQRLASQPRPGFAGRGRGRLGHFRYVVPILAGKSKLKLSVFSLSLGQSLPSRSGGEQNCSPLFLEQFWLRLPSRSGGSGGRLKPRVGLFMIFISYRMIILFHRFILYSILNVESDLPIPNELVFARIINAQS
jgi:hypothetical protein